MAVRVEKFGKVTTVIHHRPEARNPMDPASTDALAEAFLAFNADPDVRVAMLFAARCEAEALAHESARFRPACVRADRRSVYLQHGLSVRVAMKKEWGNGMAILKTEGGQGAACFTKKAGRHGDFAGLEG